MRWVGTGDPPGVSLHVMWSDEGGQSTSTSLMWLVSTLYDAALRSTSGPTMMFPHELGTKEEMELAVNLNRGFAHSLSNKCFLTRL